MSKDWKKNREPRIRNQADLEAWLEAEDATVGIAVASRAALRVLPLTVYMSSLLLPHHREELIVDFFGANAVARVSALQPRASLSFFVQQRAWKAAEAADATDAAAYAAGASAAFAIANPARAVARASDAAAFARARGQLPSHFADTASIVMRSRCGYCGINAAYANTFSLVTTFDSSAAAKV